MSNCTPMKISYSNHLQLSVNVNFSFRIVSNGKHFLESTRRFRLNPDTMFSSNRTSIYVEYLHDITFEGILILHNDI